MVDVSGPAKALADALIDALPGWVERSVERAYQADRREPPADVVAAARRAGAEAAAEIGPVLRALLEADIDDQHTTPLTVIREAVRFPTEVLRAHGVRPRPRDQHDQAMFPHDDYDLTPANFADIDPSIAELGIVWGAAKAFAHRERHR